jgi:hypothetical protein
LGPLRQNDTVAEVDQASVDLHQQGREFGKFVVIGISDAGIRLLMAP